MIIMCMTTIKNKVRICPFIYIVCLLLFAACSNEDNAGKDIPSATFSIAPERGQIEGEIQFTNASYGGSGNFTYVWDFGDGTTSTEENPKHVYNEKGIFVVSLTITDSQGRRIKNYFPVKVVTNIFHPIPLLVFSDSCFLLLFSHSLVW